MSEAIEAIEAIEAKPESRPAVFVGHSNVDRTVVMRRINVHAVHKLPDKEVNKLTPLEEIPLLRMAYSFLGGRVIVTGHITHDVFKSYTLQNLTQDQVESIVRTYRRTYNNFIVGQVRHQIFDMVYGKDEDCKFIEKMRALVEMWDETTNPASIDGILDAVFPHVSQEAIAKPDTRVMGLADLRKQAPPEPKSKPTPAPQTPTIEAPAGFADDTRAKGAEKKSKKKSKAEKPREAVVIDQAPAPDTELVDFLCSKDRSKADRFTPKQAYQIAAHMINRPQHEWGPADYAKIENLTINSHARLTRVLTAFAERSPEEPADVLA